jgi:hypothetical protein
MRASARTGDSGTQRHVAHAARADDEQAGDDEPDAATDAEHGRDRPDARRDLLARELVADDPDGEREDAAAEAGDRAPGDHDDQRVGQRGDDRAAAEQAQADEQPALLAVHVAEAADDRRGHRGGQQEGRQQPGRVGRVAAELALDGRHRRHDHRLGQRVRQGGAGEHQQRATGVRVEDAVGARAHRRSSMAAARRARRRAACSRSPGSRES